MPWASHEIPVVRSHDPRELFDAFTQVGCCLVPGAIPGDAVERLALALEDAPVSDDENPLSLGAMRFKSNVYRESTEVAGFLATAAITSLVAPLTGGSAWVRWDQAVWKRPGAPEFPLHQDNGYTNLDAEHVQIWVALTPMTRDNGGLYVVPGAHRSRLPHRWVGHHVVTDVAAPSVHLEAAAGDVVVFSSFLPHGTTPNTTTATRLAYVAEFLPLDAADDSVPPPHLVTVVDGRPHGRFEPGAPVAGRAATA